MSGIGRWFRWEMGRELQVTPMIRFITVERFVKGSVLIAAGVGLVVVSGTNSFHEFVLRAKAELDLNPGQHLWRRLWDQLLVRFGQSPARTRDALGVGAVLYGVLELIEGAGLLLRRRWAEYLVLVATCAFLPVEVDEVVRRPTAFKGLVLLVNLAIVAYLVWRKRLFLERPGTATEASPA